MCRKVPSVPSHNSACNCLKPHRPEGCSAQWIRPVSRNSLVWLLPAWLAVRTYVRSYIRTSISLCWAHSRSPSTARARASGSDSDWGREPATKARRRSTMNEAAGEPTRQTSEIGRARAEAEANAKAEQANGQGAQRRGSRRRWRRLRYVCTCRRCHCRRTVVVCICIYANKQHTAHTAHTAPETGPQQRYKHSKNQYARLAVGCTLHNVCRSVCLYHSAAVG